MYASPRWAAIWTIAAAGASGAGESAGAVADGVVFLRRLVAVQARHLAALEAQKRVAARDYRTNAGMESERALALGERARDIVDLMDRLEEAGDLRDKLAALPGPLLRPARPAPP